MPTEYQVKQIEKLLREYRKTQLARLDKQEQNEARARMMVDQLITRVLGYDINQDVTTEQRINEKYADYVIKLGRKQYFVVEAKSIGIEINHKHLDQARKYALDEGIDWIILTNGWSLQLYRVVRKKQIQTVKLFECDFTDLKTIKNSAENIVYLSKKSIQKDELNQYWKKCDTLSNENIAKMIQSQDVIATLRRQLKRNTGIYFADEDISKAVMRILCVGK